MATQHVSQITAKLAKDPESLFAEGTDFSNSHLSVIKALHDEGLLRNSTVLKQHEKEKLIVAASIDLDQVWEQLNLHFNPLLHASGKYLQAIQKQLSDEKKNGPSQKKTVSQEQQQQKKQQQKTKERQRKQLDVEENDDDEGEKSVDDALSSRESEEDDAKEAGDPQELEEMEKFLEMAENQDEQWMRDMENPKEFIKQFEGEDGSLDEDDEGSDELLDRRKLVHAKDFYNEEGEEDDEMEEEGEEGDDYDDEYDGQNDGQAPKRNKKVKERANDDEIEDLFDEQRELRLQESEAQRADPAIERLEKELLENNDKEHWQMKGEVRARDRPLNSLLEETLEFKTNVKPVAELTAEYAASLEEIIKRRILDEAFDDRTKVIFDQKSLKELLQTDAQGGPSTERSGKGLGDLYEEEFRNALSLPTATKEDKAKLEILNLFNDISYKLDQLSSLSFTPKAVIASIEASNNNNNSDGAKTGVMRVLSGEKIPIAVSLKGQGTVSDLAQELPKKVFDAAKEGVFETRDEMTHDEKQRLHRRAKRIRRTRIKEKAKKQLNKALQHKGETKFALNAAKQARAKGKLLAKQKNQTSVKFTKSQDFFKNL